MQKAILAVLALICAATSALTQAQAPAPVAAPDEKTIADAYIYLLGRALVIRQEHMDRNAPGSAAARRLSLRFTGTAREMIEVATLTRTLRQGEVVKGSDVTIERRPKAEAGLEGVSPEQAIGLAAKAPLRAGQALRQSDLMKPLIVQRNEPVTIIYEVPGIVLTVRGKAVESGAAGDIVSVLNIQSNRTVQATVTGQGRVTVGSSAPIVAAAVASPASDDQARNTQ